MTDQTGRGDDENVDRPADGTADEPPATPQQGRDESGSVLSGFSWDDPAGGAEPVRPDDTRVDVPADTPTAGDGDASGATPAQAPPGSPYPSAGSGYDGPQDGTGGASAVSPADGAGDPYTAPSSGAPEGGYGAPPSGSAPPYGTPQPYGTTQPYGGQPSGTQPSSGQPYGGQPYGGQPYGTGQAPGTPQPYGTQPYGTQPYVAQPYGGQYGYQGVATDPEQEKARSSAVLWTVLNGVAIFLCGNLLAIGGVICAAVAIGKAREDVRASRNLTKWSWILFAAGFVLGLLFWIVYFVVIVGMLGTGAFMGEF
jgi:hypothetical protein